MSPHKQDLARQIKALKRVGRAVIYADTVSGKSMARRPELTRALDDRDSGGELVIAEWDRATRSMWDGLQIIKPAIDAGATIDVLDRGHGCAAAGRPSPRERTTACTYLDGLARMPGPLSPPWRGEVR